MRSGSPRQDPVIANLRKFLKHDNARRMTKADMIAWRNHLKKTLTVARALSVASAKANPNSAGSKGALANASKASKMSVGVHGSAHIQVLNRMLDAELRSIKLNCWVDAR